MSICFDWEGMCKRKTWKLKCGALLVQSHSWQNVGSTFLIFWPFSDLWGQWSLTVIFTLTNIFVWNETFSFFSGQYVSRPGRSKFKWSGNFTVFSKAVWYFHMYVQNNSDIYGTAISVPALLVQPAWYPLSSDNSNILREYLITIENSWICSLPKLNLLLT